MNYEDDILNELRSYTRQQWFDFIESIVKWNVTTILDLYDFETIDHKLVFIASLLERHKDSTTYYVFEDVLTTCFYNGVCTYVNFPTQIDCYRLFSLLNCYRYIEISSRSLDILVDVYLNENLISLEYDGVPLHTTLLGVLSEINLTEYSMLYKYLLENLKIDDQNHYRYALKFVAKWYSSAFFLEFFERLLFDSNAKASIDVLLFALLEFRRKKKSFMYLLNWIIEAKKDSSLSNSERFNAVMMSLDTMFVYGNECFDNDSFAKLIKVLINEDYIIPSRTLLEIIQDTSYNAYLEQSYSSRLDPLFDAIININTRLKTVYNIPAVYIGNSLRSIEDDYYWIKLFDKVPADSIRNTALKYNLDEQSVIEWDDKRTITNRSNYADARINLLKMIAQIDDPMTMSILNAMNPVNYHQDSEIQHA